MRNPRSKPAHRPSRRTMGLPMAAHVRTRSHGLIKMATTIKAPRPMLSYPTFFTSKESWRDATASTAWVQTIRATALPGEIPPRTTATWQANIGQDDKPGREYSPIRDLRYSRDRRSLRTSFTISILPFRLKGCIGSRLCQQRDSRLARMEKQPRCR